MLKILGSTKLAISEKGKVKVDVDCRGEVDSKDKVGDNKVAKKKTY